ncbi:MAG TPA: hypothetical protein VFF58_00880 [Candidatus Nitrosotalea sp.]|nr:hypothetical protein [Candidatus Nitrosotalea sp.]
MTPGKSHTYPFEVPAAEIESRLEEFVASTVASLSSFYLELPRGDSFLDYEAFKPAYDELRALTDGFKSLGRAAIHEAVKKNSLILVVLRAMVGLSPPELADMATGLTGIEISQGFARTEDGKAKSGTAFQKATPERMKRILALVDAACDAIEKGPPDAAPQLIHRLHKIDTERGLASVQYVAEHGVEYPALLYERMLGGPFATHRNSISGLVGDIVEDAVAAALAASGVPFHKTGHAEAIDGFDQAPDFLIPDKEHPKVVIEAKLTQDDGTARDKVTRVQHLASLSENGKLYEVVACIDGRGFKVRPENMRKLIRATRGKVFAISTMSHLVEQTSLKNFARKP